MKYTSKIYFLEYISLIIKLRMFVQFYVSEKWYLDRKLLYNCFIHFPTFICITTAQESAI